MTESGLALYRAMARVRATEEAIARAYPEQEMRCPTHLSIGQEAVAVGVSAALRRSDLVLSNHRDHAHYIAKGGDVHAMVAELYGRSTGCSGGRGGSMHLVDLSVGFLGAVPIVGATIPLAVGAAMAEQYNGTDAVVVSYLGEAATEEGAFHEALNAAALWSLPVLFVVENNLYSVYSPMEVRQHPDRDICAIAAANGVPSAAGDGNDVLAVHRLATEAVQRARDGGGPTLLLLDTYRWREHCGPHYDNDLGYRTEEEYREWRRRCPLESLAERLRASGVPQDDLRAVTDEEEEAAAAILRAAREDPLPDPATLHDRLHATPVDA